MPESSTCFAAAAQEGPDKSGDKWEVDFKNDLLMRRHKSYRSSYFVPENASLPKNRLSRRAVVNMVFPVNAPRSKSVEWGWKKVPP